MIERGIKLDTVTCNSLIDEYCLQRKKKKKKQKKDDAIKAFNTMVEMSCLPSIFCLTWILQK